MIKLNFMEKLLEGVEIEWKKLGEVAELYGGLSGKNKEDFDNGNALYISYKNIFDNIEINFDKLESVKVSDSENQHEVKYGDILFTGSSETAEEAGISSSVTKKFEDRVYLNSFSFGVRFNDDIHMIPQFSKYLFRSHFMRTEIAKTASGVTRFNISKARFKKLSIPIPPIKVQEEIVRILDTFTELTAELIAELAARKKQYTYYRDKLLTFEEGEVEWKALGEVAEIFDSLHQTPQYSDHGLSMIRVTDIKGGFLNLEDTLKVSNEIFRIFTKKYLPQKYDLVMSRVGSYGNVSIIPSDNAVCMGQNTVVIHPLINSKYLYYILLSNSVQSFIERNVRGGSQKTLSLKSIKAIPIPIVNEIEQARIVSILDKFDVLTSSMTEGLPREIELRQKQYEYYRNMLLSFPKEGVEE